ncbi:ComF family protein [Luteimonas sp. A478]
MQVEVRKLEGSWDLGYALHKHMLSSVYLGEDQYGHARFDNTRSEPGEALYKLKYRSDWSQIAPLAAQIQASLLPLFGPVGLIIPMPPSIPRRRQPVHELANELGRITGIPMFDNIVIRSPPVRGAPSLKDLHAREEKDAALEGRFSINPGIVNAGHWNALVLDDLFDTGASMEAACKALRTYSKINHIYAAAITWK